MYCRLWVYLFLVTSTIGTRHLTVVRAESSAESSTSVVWSSPVPGDRFGPGDTIIGKWQAQPQKVVSPSFRLCAGGENGCGATVWPQVKESAGSYLVSVYGLTALSYRFKHLLTIDSAAPNVTTESAYYLQMKDDFGHAYPSPIFNLTREHAPDRCQIDRAHVASLLQPRPKIGISPPQPPQTMSPKRRSRPPQRKTVRTRTLLQLLQQLQQHPQILEP
jgi:hypothetical protein